MPSLPIEQFIRPLLTRETPSCSLHTKCLHASSLYTLSLAEEAFAELYLMLEPPLELPAAEVQDHKPAVMCMLVSPMLSILPFFPKLTPSCNRRGRAYLKVSVCWVCLIMCIFSSGSCVSAQTLLCYQQSTHTGVPTPLSYLSVATAMRECRLDVREVCAKL